jgi:protein SCO1/2
MRTLGRWLLWGVLVAVLLGIAVLTVRQQIVRFHHPDLPRIVEVPAFDLVDPGGQRVRLEDFRGSPWVAALFSTRCTGDCPPTLDRLAALGKESSGDGRTRWVALTLDPEHDTPAVLRVFARQKLGPRALSRWSWLTGDGEALRLLLREGILVPKAPAPESAPEASVGVPARPHLVLVDRDGWVRGYYDARNEGEMVLLRRDLESLTPR